MGENAPPFAVSLEYADLTPVGALFSDELKVLGTATLVAPRVAITAAHVVKRNKDEYVLASEWKFFLGSDRAEENAANVYSVEKILVHEAWSELQDIDPAGEGEGDALGVDLALIFLTESVKGVYPAKLPSSSDDDPLGKRTILGGFGSLVEGESGESDDSNQKRVAGENVIDRSVVKVSKDGVSPDLTGGILGIDFDSGEPRHNRLTNGQVIGRLGDGTSDALPLEREATPAMGDSGGPAFVYSQKAWRLHGVVSYGSYETGEEISTYGEVTVLTRLASHLEWIWEKENGLPDWAQASELEDSGWRHDRSFGYFMPFESKWIYHARLGWLYVPEYAAQWFWSWSELMKKWIWVHENAFPWVYSYHQQDQSGGWLFFKLDSDISAGLWVYDQKVGTWSVLDT